MREEKYIQPNPLTDLSGEILQYQTTQHPLFFVCFVSDQSDAGPRPLQRSERSHTARVLWGQVLPRDAAACGERTAKRALERDTFGEGRPI